MITDANIQGREANARNAGWFARNGPIAARVLMGLIFLVFGLNMLLSFLPQPPKPLPDGATAFAGALIKSRSEEHTSELQSLRHLVCRLLLEKKSRRPM